MRQIIIMLALALSACAPPQTVIGDLIMDGGSGNEAAVESEIQQYVHQFTLLSDSERRAFCSAINRATDNQIVRAYKSSHGATDLSNSDIATMARMTCEELG